MFHTKTDFKMARDMFVCNWKLLFGKVIQIFESFRQPNYNNLSSWSCSPPAAEYALAIQFWQVTFPLWLKASWERVDRSWPRDYCLTGLMGSSTQTGTSCTKLQLISSSVTNCQALTWQIIIVPHLLILSHGTSGLRSFSEHPTRRKIRSIITSYDRSITVWCYICVANAQLKLKNGKKEEQQKEKAVFTPYVRCVLAGEKHTFDLNNARKYHASLLEHVPGIKFNLCGPRWAHRDKSCNAICSLMSP